MARQTIGIIVNGATGRIGSTQHLANALVPIIAEGGLALEQERLLPRLLLVGRDAERLAAVARNHKLADWTTDLDAALADPAYPIFFDAAATQQRVSVLEKAIAAGKHVYCEKPVAPKTAQALTLLREAGSRGLKHGVVEDKVHLPGLRKLAALVARGELGRLVGCARRCQPGLDIPRPWLLRQDDDRHVRGPCPVTGHGSPARAPDACRERRGASRVRSR
jgi:predicted dehydrogenase